MRFRRARLAVLGVAVLFGIACMATGSPSEPAQRRGQRRARPAPHARPPAARGPSAPQPRAAFSHRVEAHARACDTCHTFPTSNWKSVRAADAFPDVTEYPTHGSCLGCHREQFFARERPAPKICSVCHVAVTPRFVDRLPFPNPSAPFLASEHAKAFVSEFEIAFPHETHIALMSDATDDGPAVLRVALRQQSAAKGPGVCATCHETYRPQGKSDEEYAVAAPSGLGDGYWLKKGTFETSPTSHESCFTCHAADSGLKPAPSDCATCHKLPPGLAAPRVDFDPAVASAMGVDDPATLRMWRRRDCSATFRHEGGFHPEVACTSCHDVAAMSTADATTTKVRVMSCGGDMGCHVTATVDDGGALNFEIERRKSDATFRCVKCHLAFGAAAIPQGHLDAITALRK